MSKREALLSCADAFGKRLSEDTVRVWMDDLSEYPEMTVVEAFKSARRSFQRFPTISALRDLCGADVADRRRKQQEGKWLPPLEYTVEDKRRFLQFIADGRKPTPRTSTMIETSRYPTMAEQKLARDALELSDEEIDRLTMPRLVVMTIPNYSEIGSAR